MKNTEAPVQKVAFTVDEFCKSVGIGVTKFYSEVKAGRIQAKKSGTRTIVPTTEAAAYINRLPDMKCGVSTDEAA